LLLIFTLIRYTKESLIQLAILPGPEKPKDIDSFLKPIIAELKDLSIHGMIVRKNLQEICRAKVHLMICSGDIPAVADVAHIGSHSATYGCRICEVRGSAADNRRGGMYFSNFSAPLRPLNDFIEGNEVRISI
jgi:hypothetical protein